MTILIIPWTGCNIRCAYCVKKGSKVLMSDLTWKPIEEVKEGEEVLGIEFNDVKYKHIRFKPSKVIKVHKRVDLVYKVVTDKGTLYITDNHAILSKFKRWLSISPEKTYEVKSYKLKEGHLLKYVAKPTNSIPESDDYIKGYLLGVFLGDGSIVNRLYKYNGNEKRVRFLRLAIKSVDVINRVEEYLKRLNISYTKGVHRYRYKGSEKALPKVTIYSKYDIKRIINPNVEKEDEFLRGFVAGIYDTDGSTSNVIRFMNKDDRIIEKICKGLSVWNFSYRIEERKKRGIIIVRLLGGLKEMLRFVSTFRPANIERVKRIIQRTPRGYAKVLKIEVDEVSEVYNLTTETENYIVEGFIVHNCFARTLTHMPQKIPNINLSKIEETLRRLLKNSKGHDVVVHGGEPLALPKYLLEALFKIIYEVNGRASIQTNLYALDEDHIEMFKKYNVSVGASIDGPPELNILRGFPDNPKLQKIYLRKVYENLDILASEKIPTSIIAVLHKINAGTSEAREKMKKWFLELADKGITQGRTNPLFDPFESPNVVKYRLTPEELAVAWEDFFRFFMEHPGMYWSPYKDVIDVMLGQSVSVCVFGRCDVFASEAAIAIYPDGSLGTCDRYYGFGLIRRQDPPLRLREYILQRTECRGCKYWKLCRGGCPMEAPGGDWRRKTYFCKAYYRLLETAEKHLKALMPNIVLAHEVDYDWINEGHDPFKYIRYMRSTWRGVNRRIGFYKERIMKEKQENKRRAVVHGDSPHGDWTNHGDSG